MPGGGSAALPGKNIGTLLIFSDKILYSERLSHNTKLTGLLQGGPPGRALPLVDIKTKVPSEYSVLI